MNCVSTEIQYAVYFKLIWPQNIFFHGIFSLLRTSCVTNVPCPKEQSLGNMPFEDYPYVHT